MTPPTVSASQHEPNSCMFARVSPAVVQQPDPRAGIISSDRNVHTDALCRKRPHQPVWLCDTSSNCLSQHRPAKSSWSQAQSLMFALLCGLLFFCQSVQARIHGSSIFDRELVYDHRPMPKPRMGIYARQDDSSSSSATTTTESFGILAPSSTSTSSVSESIQVATPVSTSLPRPFDTSIGNNFTESSCPQFFNNFLSNSTFQECLPFSMLLQTSNSFFAAMKSPLSLIRTIDATCHLPSYSTCSTLMSSLAIELSTAACKTDLSLENPVATQAYNGLVAYDTLYAASCLTSSTTGNYCYADAVSNSSAPTSSYIYYLPLGMSLPGGARPACTQCLKDTMSVFAAASGSRQGGFRNNYAQAAQVVDLTCGPGFVEAGLATSGGSKPGENGGLLMATTALAAILINVFL